MENENGNTPTGSSTDDGQVVITPSDQSMNSGQGTEGADTSSQPQLSFEERASEFFVKKGWEPEKGYEQLLSSYEALESKLGNWSEIEQRAKEYEELHPRFTEASEKARLWDLAQENLARLEQEEQIKGGQFDYSKAPTEVLAKLWKDGKVGLADLPPERQFEVQKFASEQDSAFNTEIQTKATTLVEKHPILKDPEIMELVAMRIEKGVFDKALGRELTPDEIVGRLEQRFQLAEKKGEERLKTEQKKVLEGNLERSDTTVATKPKQIIKSVRDAFLAAKAEQEGV